MAKRRPASRAGRIGRRVTIFLDAVELARGHDGFLRGKPEPALIFAVWSVGPSSARLLGRALRRLVVRRPFPCTSIPDEIELLRAASSPGDDRIAVLAAALEVDDGTDLGRIFAALGDEDAVVMWSDDAPAPEPHGLAEAARQRDPARPPGPVRLLCARADVEDSCRGDQWVGASFLVRPIGAGVTEDRLRVLSRDQRNDWTACLRLRT
jgi:hypothetical protein